MATEVDPPVAPRASARRLLLVALVAAFAAGAVYLASTGGVSPAGIRGWLVSLGAVAPIVFLGAFVGGAFVGVPGVVFVVAGRLAFGPWPGFALGFTGGMLAVTLPFGAARWLRRADGPVWQPRGRWVARAFALIDHHPFAAVLLLRLIVWFNPPLSYALALTPIRFPVYVAACALALAPVVALVVVAINWFV